MTLLRTTARLLAFLALAGLAGLTLGYALLFVPAAADNLPSMHLALKATVPVRTFVEFFCLAASILALAGLAIARELAGSPSRITRTVVSGCALAVALVLAFGIRTWRDGLVSDMGRPVDELPVANRVRRDFDKQEAVARWLFVLQGALGAAALGLSAVGQGNGESR